MSQVEKIIEVAEELRQWGGTAASTGERIAGAFVLNRQDLLPELYSDMVEAWDRLDPEFQEAVREIKRRGLVEPCQEVRLPPRLEPAYLKDLIQRLRAMARFEHDDFSIGDEAADVLQAFLDTTKPGGADNPPRF